MRRLRVLLAQHADDLLQLRHQPGLVLEPSGGVDQEHVGPRGPRLLERVEGEAGRVGPLPPLTTGVPVRAPQTLSCSTAAARNVSPAASITVRPSARSFEASLPKLWSCRRR